MRVGQRVLLPAVRDEPNALVITDGFSCRSQIEHGADRQPLHLAQVLKLALDSAPARAAPRDEDGRAAKRRQVHEPETREVAT
jgi:hypothetical protein